MRYEYFGLNLLHDYYKVRLKEIAALRKYLGIESVPVFNIFRVKIGRREEDGHENFHFFIGSRDIIFGRKKNRTNEQGNA